jgi:hypothetical protein
LRLYGCHIQHRSSQVSGKINVKPGVRHQPGS